MPPCRFGVGKRQRRHAIGLFTGDAQWFSTGSEDAHAGTGAKKGRYQLGAGRKQMFAVIENKEQRFVFEMGAQRLRHGLARLLLDAKHGGHGLRNQRGIGQAAQVL